MKKKVENMSRKQIEALSVDELKEGIKPVFRYPDDKSFPNFP
ncbi:hypothetical protein [Pseudolactococcus piscium]|nr:hypothetical protein [Lactococcus piscium]